MDIRKFQIASGLLAEVEFGAKIIDAKGRIVATRIFRASVPAQSSGAPEAVAALDQALAKAGPDLVGWAARTISEQGALRPVIPKKATNG
jgi:ABC-type uncharacterized transport system auxiliary subunit